MEKELMKKHLIQIIILIAAYYIIPPLVADFIGVSDDLTMHIPLIVGALIGGLIIYKLLELKVPIEEKIKEVVNKLAKEKLSNENLSKITNGILMLLYVIVISLVALPIIGVFVSIKLLTLVKVAIVIYCLYQIYQIWDCFSVKKT
ncbi:MAG: hypothetical protein WC209_08455 [Ignavibacteriaceae bacterium]|jgi:hypothetical protein